MSRTPPAGVRRAGARGLSFVALVVVVAVLSAGTAAAGALVTGRQIKDGTVTGVDLRDGTVGPVDLRDGDLLGADVLDRSLGTADFAATTRAGLKGLRGAQGPAGGAGLTGLELLEATQQVAPNANDFGSLRCPAGKVVLSVAAEFGFGAQTTIRDTDNTGLAFVHNDNPAFPLELKLRVLCGVVAP